jgi:hypothetical protein
VLVDVVRWRQVGPWRSRIVLTLAQLPSSVSSADQRAISRPGRRRDCLGEFGYIAAMLFVVWSNSASKKEVFHGLSFLSTCTLVLLCSVDPIEIAIESGHASPELGQPLHDNRSYSCRVCFPGSAASTRFTCFPTFSGKSL